MQSVPVVFFFRLHCEGYIADLLGSARWLIEISSAILKSARQLVYERKFKSEYLERKIYERLLEGEPSIVKLIENKSDLSKLSTFSESSIVKFIENQSEH